MDNLRINTSQNVDIENDVASIGDRMLAHLIDYCIFFAYFMIILLVLSFSIGNETSVMIILLLPLLFYDLLFEYFYNGQNLGKRVAKIKVVRIDGAPASFGNYMIRWLFRIVDNVVVWGAVSVITLIFNGRGQRLGDMAAGTTVIRVSKKVSLAETVFANVPQEYTLVYPAVKQLTEKDIETLKDVVRYYQFNSYSSNPEFAERARNAFEKKLNAKATQNTLQFFRTILMDYSYLNR
jgi:uncharacterized RDD family membrane protein YckC